jgi:tRNA threonylcarbamoyladenosine biosynthesis protein TsaB
VAVAAADSLLAVRCRAMLHGQAEGLLPMVEAAMGEAAIPVAALDLVAVTVGPGSFTGIRVGLAAAQGIALATALPLVGITGFEAVAASVDRGRGDRDDELLLAALESRRAELYVQVFGRGRAVGEPAAVPPEALGAWVAAHCRARSLLVAGDAAQRGAAMLAGRPRTRVAEDRTAAAVGVARTALRRWREGTGFGRVEPLYLRPPGVTVAHPRGGVGSL